MSSSNAVRIAFIEEATYGVTPGAGSFETARFTSEGLSGTPGTVESKQIRVDRQSSGQIVTGLTVGGKFDFELAKESQLEALLASAMYNDWTTKALVTVDLSFSSVTQEITRASGSWITDGIVVGDIVTLSGFASSKNNCQIMVVAVTSATVIKVVGPQGVAAMVTEVGTGTAFKRADKIEIGTTKKSFSMEKTFTDLTTKGINYRGMIVSDFDLKVAFGEICTGTLQFSGNDYVTASTASEFMTNARTINAPATSGSLNGSVDMPFFASGAILGALEVNSGFAVKSIGLKLANNLTPQQVIGDIAPVDYSSGTAMVSVDMSAYLKDVAWTMLAKKITQESFPVGFMVKNGDGAYGFYMPAVQVSFDDPSSGGQNQDIMLDMKGTGKVGAAGEKALYIYRV